MIQQGFVPLADGEAWLPVDGADGKIKTRIVTNSLVRHEGRGVRIQFIRIAPGGSLAEAPHSETEYWQEFVLIEGSIEVAGTRYVAPARTTIAHGMRLAEATSAEGCTLLEIAHY
jgi:hypothetical protein